MLKVFILRSLCEFRRSNHTLEHPAHIKRSTANRAYARGQTSYQTCERLLPQRGRSVSDRRPLSVRKKTFHSKQDGSCTHDRKGTARRRAFSQLRGVR